MHPSAELNDRQLIAAAAMNDKKAIEELWARHYLAGKTAARYQPGINDPEDAASEAFTRVLELIRRGRGPDGAFRPYYFTIIRNLGKQASRNPEELADDEALDEWAPPQRNVGDIVGDALGRTVLARAYDTLDEVNQTILWYAAVEGLRPREIAKLVGMQPNTVSARVVRARKALRVAWVREHVGEAPMEPECSEYLLTLASESTRPQNETAQLHLASCAACKQRTEDLRVDIRTLSVALLPAILGTSAAANYAAWAASAPNTIAPTGSISAASTSALGGGALGLPALLGSAAATALVASAAIATLGVIVRPQDGQPAPQTVALEGIQAPLEPSAQPLTPRSDASQARRSSPSTDLTTNTQVNAHSSIGSTLPWNGNTPYSETPPTVIPAQTPDASLRSERPRIPQSVPTEITGPAPMSSEPATSSHPVEDSTVTFDSGGFTSTSGVVTLSGASLPDTELELVLHGTELALDQAHRVKADAQGNWSTQFTNVPTGTYEALAYTVPRQPSGQPEAGIPGTVSLHPAPTFTVTRTWDTIHRANELSGTEGGPATLEIATAPWGDPTRKFLGSIDISENQKWSLIVAGATKAQTIFVSQVLPGGDRSEDLTVTGIP